MLRFSRWRRLLVIAVASVLVTGCAEEGMDPEVPPESTLEAALPEGAQAVSLLGETLFPPPLTEDLRTAREADLGGARATLEADPGDPDAWIWVGRREAYLGLYREAIATFSEGMALFPDDPRFLRHRGHRWISIREFDRAVSDLTEGTVRAQGLPHEIEPDGMPNAAGIPLSSLQFNLWYHLALAHYLQGDFAAAEAAWTECLEVSLNPDLQVATRYWLYLTRLRLGQTAGAAALLEGLPAAEEVVENDSYHRLLLLFRGDLPVERVAGDESPGSLGGTTMAYGIGAWHLFVQGAEDEAMSIFQTILDAPEQWPAFGYIAAEAEVARATGSR